MSPDHVIDALIEMGFGRYLARLAKPDCTQAEREAFLKQSSKKQK